MIIGKYIRMLLDERKRVVLPGFGNLEVKSREAATLPSGSRINPPGVSVRFDSGFSKDNRELAERLSAGEEMEREEAYQRVLELIDAIKFAMDKGEEYFLPGAGTFLRDEDGKVHFRSDPDWVLEPDQYGLESMDLLELEEFPEEEVPGGKAPLEERQSAEKPVAEEEIHSSPNVTPLAPPLPRPRNKKWRVIWVVAAVLIVILAVLILIPSEEFRNSETGRRYFSKKPAPEVVELEKITGDQEASESGGPVTAPETESESGQPLQTELSNNYFIIAGSFRNLKNASDLQDQLNSRGYHAEVMITENRMYRVSVASYASKEEAEKGLLQLSSEPGLHSCWLLSN
ncbi:MAG: SPOR domain-containing protein [Bacteroidales bacterium]|nr:SPOR domain-containing protein [Bacteroidales bacterium]